MNTIRPSQAYIDESRASALLEKWAPVLDYTSKSVAPIEDSHTRLNTAMLLENQETWCLKEAGPNYNPGGTTNTAGKGGALGNAASIGAPNFDPGGTPGTDTYAPDDFRLPKILIPMIRRTFPELITNEIVGVQPMAGPVGLAFALRYRYTAETLGTGIDGKNFAAGGNNPFGFDGGKANVTAGTEAGFQELKTTYTGTSAGFLSGNADWTAANGTIDNGSNYANLGNVNFVGIGNSPIDSGTGGGTGSGSGKLLGLNQLNGSGRASATLGVNDQGIVMEFEKIFTFKVSGNGWINRSSNAYKLIQAPGADKMLIVDEFMVYIDYETRTGIGSSGIAYHSDSTAYSIGFFENETGQQNMTGANFVVGGTYYTLGIMPRDFMAAASTDRGFYQDVPKTKSRVLPNRSLFWKTMRNCASTGNAPGGAHYIKIKYRILDISEEFNNAGVNHIIDSSSYHGRYAHTANLDKSYNDAGQAVQ